MSTLAWILAGIVAYWLVALSLKRKGIFPEYVRVQGPLLTIHTGRGREFLDRLSSPRRFWRAVANFGVGVSLVVMALAFLFLLLTAVAQMLEPEPTAVTQPTNVLVIPGVNEFLPLSVAGEIVLGLLIGLVVHEGGHGLLCRVEDIDIRSMGVVLFALIPIGAFVEPDEDSRRVADRGGRTRMFAAGVTGNLVVTIIAFGLLFGPVTGSMAVAGGAAVGDVLADSGADRAEIESGDRIIAVGDQPIADEDEFESVLNDTEQSRVAVELAGACEDDPDRACETEVDRTAYVMGVVPEATPEIDRQDVIVSVNDTTVSTERELRAEFEDRTVATVETEDGNSSTFPVGAYATVSPDGPLAEVSEGELDEEAVVITRIDGERVVDDGALTEVLGDTAPGDEVTVEVYVEDEPRTYEVTLDEHPQADRGQIGVQASQGYTGLIVNDFGITPYPAEQYLGILDSGSGVLDSVLQQVLVVLALPIAGIAETGLPFNFAGFTGGVEYFYETTGPLGFMGGGLFVFANILFWTAWINFNLAFFNCIPGYPLDGGHILRASAEAVVSRLPIENTHRATSLITTTIGVTMLLSLILLLFGQGLLAG